MLKGIGVAVILTWKGKIFAKLVGPGLLLAHRELRVFGRDRRKVEQFQTPLPLHFFFFKKKKK